MTTTDVRTMWQRTASSRVQDDAIRAPKLAHCPSLPKPRPEMCQYEMLRGIDQAPLYYWTNSWSSMDTKTMWQMSPSAFCDQRSEYTALDEFLGSRCLKPAGLQALAAEQTSTGKLSSGMMGITSEYSTGSAELELEWQLIVDPKPRSGLSASLRAAESKEKDNDMVNAAVEGIDTIPVGAITCTNKNLHESELTKSFRESEEVCHSEEELERLSPRDHQLEERMGKCQENIGKCSYGSQPLSFAGDASPSTMTTSISWRTANKEALAALVAQKAKERLENCDLPTPLSRSIVKWPLESCHLMTDARPESMESFDLNVMDFILQAGGEANQAESLGINLAPPDVLDKEETSHSTGHFARMSLPLTIPTKGQTSSAMRRECQSFSFADNRRASWIGGDKVMSASSLGKRSGPLREALCHSQTRAREAEKRAEESLQNYQKVAHLFFREASLSLTYRQWVGSLQVENARLKMYVHRHHQSPDQWLQQSILFSPFPAPDRITTSGWNIYRRDHGARKQMRDYFPWSEKESPATFVISGEGGAKKIMGCTLSFAFALGLSLSGAGLILGWSMGWILLAY